ncbi:MAG: shikimate dehydrogenase [Caulobacter sp.]|nr:shikimate dehydrogenase [Caulobacter sp.]
MTALRAAVVGHPITHSLSPLIHGAWIAAAGLDADYVQIDPGFDGLAVFIEDQRGGGDLCGVNVTIPFKEAALAAADEVSDRARLAGAANLLLFRADGTVLADNTDGLGLLGAMAAQAPGFDPRAGPAVILGAGGAARGAAAALVLAGAPEVCIVNRTHERAEAIAADIGSPVIAVDDPRLADANVIINATSLGLNGGAGPDIDLAAAPKSAVVMDMVYRPLRTEFLQRAAGLGLRTVDGLEMLIRQAVPSFEAFFGQAPPAGVDVRALALKAIGECA